MAAPLDDATRAAVEQAIRDGHGETSCRAIARAFDISPGTVRNIAKAAGLDGAFARAKTANATRARVTDMAARRAALAERQLELAEKISARIDAPYVVIVATKDDVFRETLDMPPLKETKDGMAAVMAAIKNHIELIRFDTKETANPAAAALVDRLADLLQLDQGNDEDVADGYPSPLPPPPNEYVDPASTDAGDDDGYVAPDMGALS